MVKTRRSNPFNAGQRGGRARGGRRRLLALVIALSAGVGLLGFAYAQSAPSFSLNSPVSFPVDI
ncbi:MAG: hypothetical protein HOI57_15520 [Rhodospirillaceae bacterium]|jgi:hypothetical protein|nr:hypothetical protein [Rhodospirillaceae bacterium]MBT5770817.1 hypothetical protein [Rhodospirillaceae bacterium]MBT7366090.1 hypothetical protein [Rhodospirillaceae bacterium]